MRVLLTLLTYIQIVKLEALFDSPLQNDHGYQPPQDYSQETYKNIENSKRKRHVHRHQNELKKTFFGGPKTSKIFGKRNSHKKKHYVIPFRKFWENFPKKNTSDIYTHITDSRKSRIGNRESFTYDHLPKNPLFYHMNITPHNRTIYYDPYRLHRRNTKNFHAIERLHNRLNKKLDELAEQVERHSHLVHRLVKQSKAISKRAFLPPLLRNTIGKKIIPSLSAMKLNYRTMFNARVPPPQFRRGMSLDLINKLRLRNQRVVKGVPRQLVEHNELMFRGKSPVEEHPTDPIPNTLMASFNTDTSLDTTPDKPNEDELTGLEDDSKLEKLNRALVESNKNDIMRLEGKINLIKTLHRLEESRRKHQQYAALLKAGKITNYDWMFQHRRSNDLSPMKSLQLVADSKSKVPRLDRNRFAEGILQRLANLPPHSIIKKEMLLRALPNVSVTKLDQLIEYIRDVLHSDEEKNTQHGTEENASFEPRSETLSNMTGDFISSLTTALSDFTDEVDRNDAAQKQAIAGAKRQMNELKFNGNIHTDPKFSGNVKVIHETPPTEFNEPSDTPTGKSTPLAPFTLPPDHATMYHHEVPTFLHPFALLKQHEQLLPHNIRLPTTPPTKRTTIRRMSRTPSKTPTIRKIVSTNPHTTTVANLLEDVKPYVIAKDPNDPNQHIKPSAPASIAPTPAVRIGQKGGNNSGEVYLDPTNQMIDENPHEISATIDTQHIKVPDSETRVDVSKTRLRPGGLQPHDVPAASQAHVTPNTAVDATAASINGVQKIDVEKEEGEAKPIIEVTENKEPARAVPTVAIDRLEKGNLKNEEEAKEQQKEKNMTSLAGTKLDAEALLPFIHKMEMGKGVNAARMRRNLTKDLEEMPIETIDSFLRAEAREGVGVSHVKFHHEDSSHGREELEDYVINNDTKQDHESKLVSDKSNDTNELALAAVKRISDKYTNILQNDKFSVDSPLARQRAHQNYSVIIPFFRQKGYDVLKLIEEGEDIAEKKTSVENQHESLVSKKSSSMTSRSSENTPMYEDIGADNTNTFVDKGGHDNTFNEELEKYKTTKRKDVLLGKDDENPLLSANILYRNYYLKNNSQPISNVLYRSTNFNDREMFHSPDAYYTDEIDDVLDHSVNDHTNNFAGGSLYSYHTVDNPEVIPKVLSSARNGKVENDSNSRSATEPVPTTKSDGKPISGTEAIDQLSSTSLRKNVQPTPKVLTSQNSGVQTTPSKVDPSSKMIKTEATTTPRQYWNTTNQETNQGLNVSSTSQSPLTTNGSQPLFYVNKAVTPVSVSTTKILTTTAAVGSNGTKEVPTPSPASPDVAAFPTQFHSTAIVHKSADAQQTVIDVEGLGNYTEIAKMAFRPTSKKALSSSSIPVEKLQDSIALPPKLLDNPIITSGPTFPVSSAALLKTTALSFVPQQYLTQGKTTPKPNALGHLTTRSVTKAFISQTKISSQKPRIMTTPKMTSTKSRITSIYGGNAIGRSNTSYAVDTPTLNDTSKLNTEEEIFKFLRKNYHRVSDDTANNSTDTMAAGNKTNNQEENRHSPDVQKPAALNETKDEIPSHSYSPSLMTTYGHLNRMTAPILNSSLDDTGHIVQDFNLATSTRPVNTQSSIKPPDKQSEKDPSAPSTRNEQPSVPSNEMQLAVPSREAQSAASSRDEQLAALSKDAQSAALSIDAQPAALSREAQPADSSRDAQPAPSSRDAQPSTSSRNVQPAGSSRDAQPAASSTDAATPTSKPSIKIEAINPTIAQSLKPDSTKEKQEVKEGLSVHQNPFVQTSNLLQPSASQQESSNSKENTDQEKPNIDLLLPTPELKETQVKPKPVPNPLKYSNERPKPTGKTSLGPIKASLEKNVFEQQLAMEFPLGEEMKMDDMYWTDSRDEIEDTCKSQKKTNLVINILAFGDSLTRGYYNSGKGHHPYTMKLQYLLNNFDQKRCFIIDNEGKDGEPAFGEMPRRMESVLRKNPTRYHWAIILGGTNDIYNKKLMRNGRHTARELSNNIISIHEIAQSHGMKTVVVTIPEVACSINGCQDMKEMRLHVNRDLIAYANENKSKTLLCDIAGTLARRKIDRKLTGQFFEGGLHLRPRGYETMARLLFESFVERIYAS